MKTRLRNTLAMAAASGLALAAVAFVGVNRALGQQQAGQAGGFAGGQSGDQGSYGFRFTQGKITAGDAAAGTITINTSTGGMQVLKVTAATTIQELENITEKDLVIGDVVKVQGIPTGISASSITAGSPPTFQGGGRVIGPGGPGAAGGGVRPEQLDVNGNVMGPPPTATANGKVVSTSPLTMSVGENMDIVLKLGHDAKVTRYAIIPFGNLKVGENLLAYGTVGQDGTFAVSSIGINMTIGNSGALRPGGRPRGLRAPDGAGGN